MSISLDKFVNVNLVHHETSTASTTRDTVILLTTEDVKETTFTNIPEYGKTLNKYYDTDIYKWDTSTSSYSLPELYEFFYKGPSTEIDKSATEIITLTFKDNLKDIYEYLRVYFNNGGVKVKLIPVSSTVSVDDLVTKISELNDEYIVVSAVLDSNVLSLSNLNKVAKKLDKLYYGTDLTTAKGNLINISSAKTKSGIHRKLLLTRAKYNDIKSKSDSTGSKYADLENIYTSKSLIVKYASCRNTYDDDLNVTGTEEQIGDEMSIAAYLSRINIDNSGSVADYCYTTEACYPDVKCEDSTHGTTSVEVDDDLYDVLKSAHFTFVTRLANQNKAVGGDTCAGYSFVNEYISIIVHQTVTNALINVLVNKPSSTTISGLMNSTICSELTKYVTNGYLTKNKTWYDSTLNVTKNGTEYTIITNGTALNKGYYVTVLPNSSLTQTEKKNHQAPYAYIILAETDAIRVIDVGGEII